MPVQPLSFARVYRRQPTTRATMTKEKLLILDDLMRESSSDVILDLFTKGSHHKYMSHIYHAKCFSQRKVTARYKSKYQISRAYQKSARQSPDTTSGASNPPGGLAFSARCVRQCNMFTAFLSLYRSLAGLLGRV